MPDISQLSLPPPEFAGAVWAEILTPLPDGFMGDHHSPLGEWFLHVLEAQREPVVELHSVTDDLWSTSVSGLQTSIVLHQSSLLGARSS